MNDAGRTYRFAGHVLDPGRGSLTGAAGEIALRPKSFDLLVYLVRNAGRVVPKGELMDAVWPHVTVTEDSLTQCVSGIRRALGDEGPLLLRTVARRGYVFSGDTLDPAEATERQAPGRPTLHRVTLPDRQSIVVLPFLSMSSDPEQGFFADGMTEDLITALSRIRELFVIARATSFAFKGRTARIEDVVREVGVRFVLEGSVRVSGSRVRVTAQLADGILGHHLWAERYDGELNDIFGLQDEITRQIVLALQVKLTYGDFARLWEGQTTSLRAWEKMVAARDLFLRFNRADNREAGRLLREALAIDPRYTGAMIQHAMVHWWEARSDITADKDQCLRLAEQQARNAIAIDPEIGSAYMVLGGIAFMRDQHEEAVRLCRKAVELAPSDSWASAFLGLICIYAGEYEQALAALKSAMRLSPHYPTWYTYQLALASLWKGDLASSQTEAEAYLAQEPDDPFAYMMLATVHSFRDQPDEAARLVGQLREKFPEFGLSVVALSQRYKDRERLERVLGVLRRAGLPD